MAIDGAGMSPEPRYFVAVFPICRISDCRGDEIMRGVWSWRRIKPLRFAIVLAASLLPLISGCSNIVVIRDVDGTDRHVTANEANFSYTLRKHDQYEGAPSYRIEAGGAEARGNFVQNIDSSSGINVNGVTITGPTNVRADVATSTGYIRFGGDIPSFGSRLSVIWGLGVGYLDTELKLTAPSQQTNLSMVNNGTNAVAGVRWSLSDTLSAEISAEFFQSDSPIFGFSGSVDSSYTATMAGLCFGREEGLRGCVGYRSFSMYLDPKNSDSNVRANLEGPTFKLHVGF